MTVVGEACTTRSTYRGTGTLTIVPNATMHNGTNVKMTTACIYLRSVGGYSNGYCKIKLFKNTSGSTFEMVAETGDLYLTLGQANNFSPNLEGSNATAINWTIGVYFYINFPIEADNGSLYYYNGDLTGSASLSTDAYDFSIRAEIIDTNLSDIYVDINKADDSGAGTSWATAKKTMKAGWDIMTAGGTMHVASGDYSTQTKITYNKNWKLSAEDPNSTGSIRVKIPFSA